MCPSEGPSCLSAAAVGPAYTCVSSFIVIFQGEDLHPEEDGPAREQQPEDDDFLVERDTDDRVESLETGTFQEGRTFFFFLLLK